MLPKDQGVFASAYRRAIRTNAAAGFLAEVEALVSRCDLHPGMPSMRRLAIAKLAHLMGECDYAEFVEGSCCYPAVSQTAAYLVEEVAGRHTRRIG